VNALIHFVPEKWTFSFWLRHQKVDGLMDITAREAGSFYTPGARRSSRQGREAQPTSPTSTTPS